MDSELQKRLLATFRVETRERLETIGTSLIDLERGPSADLEQELIEAVFRETHSLKGAARSVGIVAIETVSHGLESVFSALKRREISLAPPVFDLMHASIDLIGRLLPSLEAAPIPEENEQVRALNQRLVRAAKGQYPPPPEKTALPPAEREETTIEKSAPPKTVRIATEKLDAVLQQTEGMLTAKLAAAQQVEELREVGRSLALWDNEWKKVQPVFRRLRRLRQADGIDGDQYGVLFEFLDRNHATVHGLTHRLAQITKTAELDHHHLGGMVEAVLDDVRDALMLPFASVLPILEKSVRDLARDRGKTVRLATEGASVEIDRRILEEMKDPLLHLIRKCIDHGIESPDERMRQEKPPVGTITIALTLVSGNRVEIIVADDGAGIDTELLVRTAVDAGLVAPEETERMTATERLNLAFASGLSTSPLIDDISGRGLGLAIARERTASLGGTMSVMTSVGKGTTFRISLPLTLSTFRGVIVEVAGQLFVVPTTDVQLVSRRKKEAIATVENRETIDLAGQHLSFVRLRDILGLPQPAPLAENDYVPLFVLAADAGRIAFGVDRVVGEQEVVVKGLGKQLRHVRNFSGSTVLGNGRVVPILNSRELAGSAVQAATAGTRAIVGTAERKSVLVVEDSITSRTLLKNILEGAGYRTLTAVDGVEALNLLKTDPVDLVVSDVDMPRMDGFELTSRIRESREFAALPVVLVTSLDSREDRERGIDAGANAYIVKSSFDQSNLLDVVRRLI
ncbi:MAG: response regulator [Geobacter sp.]|nr:response regulator [Geobacter sp.]